MSTHGNGTESSREGAPDPIGRPRSRSGAVTFPTATGPWLTLGDLKSGFARFQNDQMTDHAAGLTYYALMSLFPGLLAGVALLGLVSGQSLITDTVDYLAKNGAPNAVIAPIQGFLQSAIDNKGSGVVALVFGLLIALNGASGAFGASGRALNAVFRVQEGRGFVTRKLSDVGSTLLVMIAVILTLVLLFLGGGVAHDLFATIGLGDTGATLWSIARWPAALASAMVVYALVYALAPNVKVRRLRWVTPGAVLGVVLWIVASAGFFLYVKFSGSYGSYGAFAGIVMLLLWLWLSNVALLLGAEINATVDTRRAPEFKPGYDGPPLPVKQPADVA